MAPRSLKLIDAHCCSTRPHWRLVLSEWSDPYTNMAVDEAILRAYLANIVPPTLRIYGWRPPAISLGYFQKAEEILDIARCISHNVPFVRRITGGEALFHSDELTYSIVCSKDALSLPDSVKESYKTLTGFLLNAYRILGLEASFFSAVNNKSANKNCSSYCFAAIHDFDIAINGKKLGGNAQKRIKNTIFQHGSIPFTVNTKRVNLFFREELKGAEDKVISLEDALGETIDFEQFQSIVVGAFRKTFKVQFAEDSLTAFELRLVESLKREKYGNRQWKVTDV